MTLPSSARPRGELVVGGGGEMAQRTVEDARTRLEELEGRLMAETARARTLNAPDELLERMESALRLVNSACLVGVPMGEIPSGTLDDSICKGVAVEAHQALREWERWTERFEQAVRSIDLQLDSITQPKTVR